VNERVLVLGATSAIGRAAARALARRGDALVLAGRAREELERDAADLALRHGARIEVRAFEALDFDGHAALLEACDPEDAPLDGILVCQGHMESQEDAERDFARARRMIDVNCTSVVSCLERAAPRMAARGRGWICAVSSVAGDRGRRSNYLYGATKAALSTYLEGLDARLTPAGVAVVTVKPGFVDTRLTWGRTPPALTASPERVARDIVRAVARGQRVVYTPWPWRWIMMVLRSLPRGVLRRLPL